MTSLIHDYLSFNIPYLYPFEIVGVASNARANSGPLGNLPSRKWVYIRRNEWTHWANLIDIFNLREKKLRWKIGKSELLWIFYFMRWEICGTKNKQSEICNHGSLRGLLTWQNKDDRKWPCNMTKNVEDCKHYVTTVNVTTSVRMTENDFWVL